MNLKSILKILKINESAISMVLGSIVIIVVGLFVINYFRNLEPGVALPDGINTENIALPTTHTVAKGETLWSISEKYYKTGYNWVDIAKENNLGEANEIETNQKLTIPNVTPKLADSAKETITTTAPSATPSVTVTPTTIQQPKETVVKTVPTTKGGETTSKGTYTVVKGDTLWSIAEKTYGTGYKWAEIARANKLANPNLIHTGNVFTLPN